MSKTEDVQGDFATEVIVFQVGKELLCIDLSLVKEVIEIDHVKPIPLASKKVEGIINLRGEIIPILNTRATLKLTSTEAQKNQKSKVLIIEHPFEKFGFLVDSVQEILRAEDQIFADVPDSISTDVEMKFIERIGYMNKKVLIFLDIDAIIDTSFISLPANVRAQAKGRKVARSDRYMEMVEKGAARPDELTLALNETQSDALKELANIAAGNAITALSELLKSKKKIDLFVSNVEVVNISDIPEVLGGPDKLVFAVKSEVSKEIIASNYLVFPLEGLAEILYQVAEIDIRNKKIETLKDLAPEARSAIEEIGNILTAHYITAIANFLGMKLYKETPQLGFDVLGALVDSFLIQQSEYLSETVCLYTSLKIEAWKLNGAFLFLPHKTSMDKLVKSLTVDHVMDVLDPTKKKQVETPPATVTVTPKPATPATPSPKAAKGSTKKAAAAEKVATAEKAAEKKSPKMDFTDTDLDIFSELGNIGAGHASNALSQMINKKVMIDVPIVNLMTLDKLQAVFNKIGKTITGSFSLVTKNVDANIMLIFGVESVEFLLQIILDTPKPKKLKSAEDVTENEQSAIQELNSILIGHYVSALSNFLRLPIDPPKHNFFFDTADNFYTNLEKNSEKDAITVVIETRMNVVGLEKEPIVGYFVMIPAAQNLKVILKRIQDIWEK